MITEDRVTQLRSGVEGHFAANLADAWTYADGTNRAKIEKTWPHLFGDRAKYPTPWHIHDGLIRDDTGAVVCDCDERIVACVNACHGVETLTSGQLAHERWLRDQAEAVTEATRDQREALRDALQHISVSFKELVNGWPVRELHEAPKTTLQRVYDLMPDLAAEMRPDHITDDGEDR